MDGGSKLIKRNDARVPAACPPDEAAAKPVYPPLPTPGDVGTTRQFECTRLITSARHAGDPPHPACQFNSDKEPSS